MFCLFYPGTDARLPPQPAAGWRTPDFGSVQTQLDTLGLGIGEHVSQGPEPQPRTVGDRASTLGEKPAYLTGRAGDRGTADTGQQTQDRVRQIVPQTDQRGHQPVDGHQLVLGAGTCHTLPDTTAYFVTTPLGHGLPRTSQLLKQRNEMAPGDPP